MEARIAKANYIPAPRMECGSEGCASHSCYMYRPVEPLILRRAAHDKRERFVGAMLSARESGRHAKPGELEAYGIEINKKETVIVYRKGVKRVVKKG